MQQHLSFLCWFIAFIEILLVFIPWYHAGQHLGYEEFKHWNLVPKSVFLFSEHI